MNRQASVASSNFSFSATCYSDRPLDLLATKEATSCFVASHVGAWGLEVYYGK